MIGFDAHELSKFWSKNGTKLNTLNQTFKTPRHEELMILSSSTNYNSYVGFIEGVLKAIQISIL